MSILGGQSKLSNVEQVIVEGPNFNVGGQEYVYFNAYNVLMDYYSDNLPMQQLVTFYNPAFELEPGWYSQADFEGIDFYWECFNGSDLNYASIPYYLGGFAYAYFGSQNGGTLVRPCDNSTTGFAEDDPDYLLTLVDFTTINQPQINVTLTPDDIISALESASPDQIAQIQTLLSIPPPAPPLTALEIYNAIAVGDTDTLIGIDTALGLPSTLAASAVSSWIQAIVNAAPGSFCPAVKDILQGAVEPLTLSVQVDPLVPNTHFVVTESVGGCLNLELEFGSDVVSTCNCALYDLAIPVCGGSAQSVLIPEVQLPDPSDPSVTYHSGDALQAIINLISQTSKNKDCCGTSTDWINPQSFEWNDTNLLYEFQSPARAIYVEITENPNPARINWQPPEGGTTGGVQRFGKLVFQYADGTQGPVMFFNTNKQIFNVPDNNVTGCQIYLNPDVVASVLQSGYPLWSGQTFPLIG